LGLDSPRFARHPDDIGRRTMENSQRRRSFRRHRPAPASAHSLVFLDETGTLGGERDPFFAVGLLRCSAPYEIARPVQRLRDRNEYYDEIKWGKVSTKNLPVLKKIVDVLLHSNVSFHVFIADKREHDVIGRFGGQFQAYECLARQLLHGSIKPGETVWVMADEYSTPAHVAFEENVRDYVNRKLERVAVGGACRIRSEGSDLLQMIDLLLGAIVYEYKADSGIVSLAPSKPKPQLLAHIKAVAGVDTFIGGYRDERIQVEVYRGEKKNA
jgi:hypothetical protein